MSMFTIRQKLLLGGSVLVAVLLVAGGYYGSRWLCGPDVEPLPEHLLSDRPPAVSMNRPVRASGSQDTSSVLETDLVSESEDELLSDSETESDSTSIDEELAAQLAALSDEELTALAESLEQDDGESSDYPEVPDGFPSNLKPVWLKDYFHERDFSEHVTLYRVLIELWNRGHYDIINGAFDSSGRVYPIYPDVVYLEWDSYVREGLNGESIEVPYVSRRMGAASTVDSLLDNDGKIFTEEEIISGAYRTKYPGIKFVDFDDAGYDPATILNNY